MCTRDGPAAAICPASPAVLSQLPARAAPLESTRSIVVPVEPTRLTPPSAKAGKPVPWASETPPGPLPRTASKTQGTSSATGAGDGAGGGAMCGQCVVAERQSEMLPVPPARPSWAPALHSRAPAPRLVGPPLRQKLCQRGGAGRSFPGRRDGSSRQPLVAPAAWLSWEAVWGRRQSAPCQYFRRGPS